jgi:hypothetical protein
LIPEGRTEKYVRSSSGTPTRQISAMKKEFAERLATVQQNHQQNKFEFTPPQYDDEFAKAIAKLDIAEA